MTQDELDDFRQAFRAQPRDHQRAWLLRCKGHSDREVGQILGTTADNVHVMAYRSSAHVLPDYESQRRTRLMCYMLGRAAL